jgi:hypothetical protein
MKSPRENKRLVAAQKATRSQPQRTMKCRVCAIVAGAMLEGAEAALLDKAA